MRKYFLKFESLRNLRSFKVECLFENQRLGHQCIIIGLLFPDQTNKIVPTYEIY